MATTNHIVTIGSVSNYGTTSYGDGFGYGSITPTTGPGGLSGSIAQVAWTSPASGSPYVTFTISGQVSQEALSQITIGGTTFTGLSTDTFYGDSYASSWRWNTSTNPIGTSGTVAVSIEDNAAVSVVSISGFNGMSTTEDASIAFTTTITGGSGKYFNWDIVRVSGSDESGGEISSATYGSLTDTGGTVTLTFKDNSTSEIGLHGESFRFDVYEYDSPTTPTGSPSGTPEASRTFILYDDDVTASFPGSITIPYNAGTDHTLTLTVGTGSDTLYRVYWDGGVSFHQISSKPVGTHNISIPNTPVAGAGPKTYDVYAYNGNEYILAGSYTVERLDENESLPASTYGIEVFDTNENLILSVDDETLFYMVRKTGTIGAGGTTNFTEFDLGLPTGYLLGSDFTLVTSPAGSLYYDNTFKFGYVTARVTLNLALQRVLQIRNTFNTSKDFDVTVFSKGG